MNDLHDHLLRFHSCENILADSLLLDVVAECLCYLIAYVGVKQSAADILHGLRDVDLGDLSFAFEDLERPL